MAANILGFIVIAIVIWLYEKLYDGEPWYEHLMFWTFTIGLSLIWTFG